MGDPIPNRRADHCCPRLEGAPGRVFTLGEKKSDGTHVSQENGPTSEGILEGRLRHQGGGQEEIGFRGKAREREGKGGPASGGLS